MKPTKPKKQRLDKIKDLNKRQMRILERFIKDDDEFNKLRDLIDRNEVETHGPYKHVGKFDPHIHDDMENYKLVLELATAARRWVRQTE